MRESDEPNISSDLHYWLTKLEQEVAGLRTGMQDLTRDLNELRVAQANAGQPNWGVLASLMGLFIFLSGQTAAGVYWGGGVTETLRSVVNQAQHTANIIEEHVRTAGPFRANIEQVVKDVENLETRMRYCSERQAVVIQRIDAIEARNKVADANWDVLKRKGVLVESTK